MLVSFTLNFIVYMITFQTLLFITFISIWFLLLRSCATWPNNSINHYKQPNDHIPKISVPSTNFKYTGMIWRKTFLAQQLPYQWFYLCVKSAAILQDSASECPAWKRGKRNYCGHNSNSFLISNGHSRGISMDLHNETLSPNLFQVDCKPNQNKQVCCRASLVPLSCSSPYTIVIFICER